MCQQRKKSFLRFSNRINFVFFGGGGSVLVLLLQRYIYI